jgi:8-oxo-dGTP pyrophosphatase MutT (NUDIX family)
MKEIAKPVIEDKLVLPIVLDTSKIITRHTARAIILSGNKESVLMTYSKEFNDFTFIGGGIKKGESKLEALRREIMEETGAIILKVYGFFGYIDEYRNGLYKNKESKYIFKQRSYFYFVKTKKVTEPTLEEREKAYGIEPRWISIDEAITYNQRSINNEAHRSAGLRTVLYREIRVLEAIKEWKESLKLSKSI